VLGDAHGLPSALELADAIASAEVGIVAGRGDVGPELVAAAWYLHSVASAWSAPDLYPIARRRSAFQLSAHVFDLALRDDDLALEERFRLTFAAQVGYLHSLVDPGAIAVYRRAAPRGGRVGFLDHPSVAVEAGSALLAFDTPWLFERLNGLRRELAELQERWAVPVEATPYAAAALTLDGVWFLHVFLTTGD
jgi:hypothetical protein